MNRHDIVLSDIYKENRTCNLSDTCEAGALIRGQVRALFNDITIRYPSLEVTFIETKHWLSSTFSFRIGGRAHDVVRVYDSIRNQMAQYA